FAELSIEIWSPKTMHRQIAAGLALICALCWASSHSRAEAEYEKPRLAAKLTSVAKLILAVTKQQPVRVDRFQEFNVRESNAGQLLEETLKNELNLQKPGCVADKADFAVRGEYQYVAADDNPRQHVISLQFEVRDVKTGRTVMDKGPMVVCAEPEIV